MATFYTKNQMFFLKYLIILEGFLKKIIIPIRDFLIPQKRRSSFKKRLSTP